MLSKGAPRGNWTRREIQPQWLLDGSMRSDMALATCLRADMAIWPQSHFRRISSVRRTLNRLREVRGSV